MGNRRRLTRKERKKQRKIIIVSMIGLFCIMTAGYAAFQTNLNINAKGNIVSKGITPSELKNNVVTSGDGLYKDTYEEGKYIYRGADPNNYITFNDEMWRIIAVEPDETLKIIKKDSIGAKAWDTSYSGAWATATLNTFLNDDYYNSLTTKAISQIQKYNWSVGGIFFSADQTFQTDLAQSQSVKWNGNIGLMGALDYVQASTNSNCTSLYANNYDVPACYTNSDTHNWLFNSEINQWTISGRLNYETIVWTIMHSGDVNGSYASAGVGLTNDVRPSVYLKSEITLSGEGTQSDPYTIK